MSARDDGENNLHLISQVSPGDTINIVTREIVRHNSWYAWATRKWNREDRIKLVDWVTEVVRDELQKIKDTRDMNRRGFRTERLNEAMTGVRNLSSTYYGTPTATKLNNIISAVDKVISAIKQGYTESILIDKPGVIMIDTRFGRSW